eukprot:scaffold4911_cov47-Cyclotella_meneghiniana.AAC.2
MLLFQSRCHRSSLFPIRLLPDIAMGIRLRFGIQSLRTSSAVVSRVCHREDILWSSMGVLDSARV